MKWVRTAIGAVIAISVIPVILLTVIHVTELKDVKSVQFELLSEEDGNFFITTGTYDNLLKNKGIINYDIDSNYPLLTHEELDRATWRLNEELYNEIIDRETNPRIVENVGKVVYNGEKVTWKEVLVDYNPNYKRFEGEVIPNLKIQTDSTMYPYIHSPNLPVMPFTNFTTTYFHTVNSNMISIHNLTGVINVILSNDILNNYVGSTSVEKFTNYLRENPLTVYYELAIKNPKTVEVTQTLKYTGHENYDFYRYPINSSEFKNVENDILVDGVLFKYHGNDDTAQPGTFRRFDSNNLYIRFPKGQGKDTITLIYELAQPRLVEQYDLSTFKLTFDDDRIRVLFDIDEGYYLWEITNDDRLIPIKGQYDLGNIWTVKFFVYEIQQPLIRSLVLLIPLIVISGLLLYLFKLVNERR